MLMFVDMSVLIGSKCPGMQPTHAQVKTTVKK
jgi:hypothetical protein